MPSVRFHVPLDDGDLHAGLEQIRAEFDVPDSHSEEAIAEAESVVARGPLLPPDANPAGWQDRSDLELIAIDPPGSLDLDQAFGAERVGTGYRIFYAIADVAAFVAPGGAIDQAALERGVTLYAPDQRSSLHPEQINHGAASLAAGEQRPALLWTIDLDSQGSIEKAAITRSEVRVSESITYRQAHDELAADPRPVLSLLEEIGRLRLEAEKDRGAVSLALPAQEVHRDEHGHAHLVFDQPLPVERWNAQISLLTGIAAAEMMLTSGIGILRTLPPIDEETIAALRRTAAHLDVEWASEQTYADRVRTLDPTVPLEAALLMRSARGLRGAGYAGFVRHSDVPEHPEHSAIAATYSHVTAPLRRVCDRYANEIVLAISAGRTPPQWAMEKLEDLPSIMGRTRQRERSLEKAIIEYMETLMLAPFVGSSFEAVVINHSKDGAVIQLRDPAVIASLLPKRPLGTQLSVRLVAVDSSARTTKFEEITDES